jgi:hypothetical protein
MKYCANVFFLVVCTAIATGACGPRQDLTGTPTTIPTPSSTSPPPTHIPEPTDTALPTLTPTNSPTPTLEPPPSGEIELPDVEGLTLEEAELMLASAGFVTNIIYRAGQEAPLGTVFEQRPEAGTIMEAGMVIRIYVSAELITISAAPGLEVGRNTTFSYPVELDAGVTYYFYTQDTFNITDNVEWGPLFNCCGRMSIAPIGLSNAEGLGLVFVPEESGTYKVVIHNNNPVRFSFTLVIAYFSIGE